MAELFYWRYRLRLAGAGNLNALTPGGEIEGALLRDRQGGHACLQPWPSLGQGSLDHAIEQLRQGVGEGGLLKAARHCMALDGAARAAGVDLFEGKSIPQSHLSVPDWAPIGWLEEKFSAGFALFKLKCGPDLPAESSRIEQLCSHFGESLRLRLDFNECLDPEQVRGFVALLGKRLPQVEFLEDPVPFDEACWSRLSEELPVDLAVDRAGSAATGGFRVRVIKPAWEAVQNYSHRAVITSAMDHPLGQLFAAYEASAYRGELAPCGLLTHWLFEPCRFSESLQVDVDGRLVPPGGIGLGFGDQLDALPWRAL